MGTTIFYHQKNRTSAKHDGLQDINFLAKTSGNTFIACEHAGTKTFSCPAGYAIKISGAYYGRQSNHECPVGRPDQMFDRENCVAPGSQDKIERMCQGKQSCEINPSNSVFGVYCHGTVKYVKVDYDCVKVCNER